MDAYGLLYDTGCIYNLFSYNGSDWVCPGEGCLFPSGLPLSNTCLCKASTQQQNVTNKVSIWFWMHRHCETVAHVPQSRIQGSTMKLPPFARNECSYCCLPIPASTLISIGLWFVKYAPLFYAAWAKCAPTWLIKEWPLEIKWCWNPMWKKRQRDTRICYKMENTFHYTMKAFATHRTNPWEIHSFMTTRHPIKSQ